MSADWTREEMEAAVRKMKAAGLPGLKEFCAEIAEKDARAKIERFARRQREFNFPCPRCGKWAMNKDPRRNALSRRIDVYVCDECGVLEALEDAVGEKTPLASWDIAKNENWPL